MLRIRDEAAAPATSIPEACAAGVSAVSSCDGPRWNLQGAKLGLRLYRQCAAACVAAAMRPMSRLGSASKVPTCTRSITRLGLTFGVCCFRALGHIGNNALRFAGTSGALR